jgi:very-short-patch-repair endonuclease
MLKNQAPKPNTGTTKRARSLRRSMSLPEVLLWQALRKQTTGLKFRRQHASGPYIVDFFCNDARLVIEIDGEGHSRGDQPAHDEARDRWFAKAGLLTLRIPATAVLRELDAVVIHIVNAAWQRLPLHHAAHGPPPRDKLGEDQR